MSYHQHIYDTQTAWLEAKLRMLPYTESSEPPHPADADVLLRTGDARGTIALTPADVRTLRRCWAVCEALHQQTVATPPVWTADVWPGWPRDLRPRLIEVFALAAFAHGKVDVRHQWESLHAEWPDFHGALRELVYERLAWPKQVFPAVPRYTLDDDLPVPFLPFRDVVVPSSCAADFYDLLKRFAYVTRQYQRITDYLQRLSPGALRTDLNIDTSCIFHLSIVSSELSYAGAMLLMWWLAHMTRHMQWHVAHYQFVMKKRQPEPASMPLRPPGFNLHTEMVKATEAYTVLNVDPVMVRLRALSAEYFRTAEMNLAAACGQHSRMGADSILKRVDPLVAQTIGRMMWDKTTIFPNGAAAPPRVNNIVR